MQAMKTPLAGFGSVVLGIGLFVLPNTHAAIYDNCNFGLVSGEPQFLAVDNPSASLADQFNYVVTGPFDYTTATLKQGFAYDIRISGRVGLGPLDGSNNSTPDAAYTFVNWQNLDLVHVTGTDGIPWVTHWDGISGRRPSPDLYSTTHVYDYYVEGQNAGLSFSFRDNPYWDNIGGFQVSVFEVGNITGGTPPDINGLSVTPSNLWPPNNKLVFLTIDYSVIGNCGDVTTTVTATSNEPDSGHRDVQLIPGDSHHLYLRAGRLGSGTGRIYTITVTATDGCASTSSQNISVVVPHDQGKR
jgi:hypothetical protein